MSKIHYGKCEKCNYMGGLNDNLICLCCLDEKALLNKKAKKEILTLQKENTSKDETIAKLRECVEFYADRKHWGAFDFVPNDGESFYQGNDGVRNIWIIQAGKKARKTLKELEGGE